MTMRTTIAVLLGVSLAPGAYGNATPALKSVEQANRLATVGPRQAALVNATTQYPWSEGAIFRLYTSPGRISDITLEAGETLVSVAAGDTARWIVGNTSSGTASDRREHILVKPTMAGLSTNLLILTDRRSYHLDIVSTPTSAMTAVSWSYPQNALISLKASELAAKPDPNIGVDPSTLNFAYTISGESVPWRPLRAFDDGSHVYIEFPADIGAGTAPPLFVTDGKQAELVNYRMHGHFYVVDRLFARAELRLGDKPQHVVQIRRAPHGMSS